MSYARVLHIEETTEPGGGVIPAHDAIVSTASPPDILSPPDPTADGRDWDLRQHEWSLWQWENTIIGPHGWLPVVATERPPDTATDTHTYTIELIDGVPTEVWTSRPWTPDELAGQESMANTTQMVAESDESVDKLVAVIEALNAITDMTNASINQNPAAVIKNLTRECKTIARQVNREARMTSGRTEDTDTGPVTDV